MPTDCRIALCICLPPESTATVHAKTFFFEWAAVLIGGNGGPFSADFNRAIFLLFARVVVKLKSIEALVNL